MHNNSDATCRLGVKYVLFAWTDLFGVMRSKLVPAKAAAGVAQDGAGFAGFAGMCPHTAIYVSAGGADTSAEQQLNLYSAAELNLYTAAELNFLLYSTSGPAAVGSRRAGHSRRELACHAAMEARSSMGCLQSQAQPLSEHEL